MIRKTVLAGALALAFAVPAAAQHVPAPAPASPAGGRTADLQGDTKAFMENRNIRAFYALSKETLGQGVAGVDVAAYEQKAFALFRALGTDMGMKPEAMQDHLKLIPRQVVDIVKADPHVLDSFDTFTEALIGPR